MLRKCIWTNKRKFKDDMNYNREFRDLFHAPDVVSETKSSCLRWAGHVMRTGEEVMVKQVCNGNPDGRIPRGRPKKKSLAGRSGQGHEEAESERRSCSRLEEMKSKSW